MQINYDIRKPCVGILCYDFSNLEKFLNLKHVVWNRIWQYVQTVVNMPFLCIFFAHLTAKFGSMSLPYVSSADR